MSIINTKAGWVCQEDYFVDGTGECGTRNDKAFSKTNDGAAICAKYVYNDTSNIILVSTVESYTAATYDGAATNIVTISAVIDDVTWYGTYYSNGADNWITSYPTVTGTVAISSVAAEDVISKILITAQAKRDDGLPTGEIVKDLVTVDYVKSLLTNILTENNTRIFRQIDLMELLKYTEQTLTEQQQAQARQNLGITGGGVDYSTTEQDTGIKWVDGKSVYQKTYVFDPPVTGGGYSYVSVADVSGLSIDTLISISGVQHDQGGNYIMSLEAYSNVGDNMYLRADKSAVMWKSNERLDWMTIKYTKLTT